MAAVFAQDDVERTTEMAVVLSKKDEACEALRSDV